MLYSTSTRLIKILLPFHVLPDGVAVLLAVTRFLRSKSATTTFVFFRAYWTLNKQQVAAIILQLVWLSHGVTALVAMRDNLIRYTFAHPLVKNKFLPIKRTGKPCSRALRAYSIPPSICQTLLNPLCFIRGRWPFTTNAAGAVHDDFYLYVPASSRLLFGSCSSQYLPEFRARFKVPLRYFHSGYACR